MAERGKRPYLTDEQLDALALLDVTDLRYASISWRAVVDELKQRRAAEREAARGAVGLTVEEARLVIEALDDYGMPPGYEESKAYALLQRLRAALAALEPEASP